MRKLERCSLPGDRLLDASGTDYSGTFEGDITKRLKRKVQSLWPPTAQTFVLDTAATL